MRWPWVSRLAFDAVVGERDHLRAECAKLTESLTRINRREAGLPEVPRAPRPPLLPMPAELRSYIDGFENRSVRKDERDRALKRHAAGEPWASIVADVVPKEERSNG